ncbi:MAG: chromosome segregation protein SMC [Firmicutes bacterium]|nr:chromosome segregation protein SMC [Bacillota bacterium]
MHLKQVRIYGFKSFGQEVAIHLAPGITALVGPNGGGKSNVVDAIRWALGEQRLRELRAERWEDLLFRGGTAKASARMAEVVLEFDNHDGAMAHWPESLTVARRYYKSGESEYLVNGQSVRLKDLLDLFLDSGVGRHSYAIISQGRVEHALMMKPEERLELLEEAAGVSRYKVRKKETLQHLREVEAKLTRLDDLLAEVERQRAEVYPRAMVETQYRALESERQFWQERLDYAEYSRAMARAASLEDAQKSLREEHEALCAELQAVEAGLKEWRAALGQHRSQEREDGEAEVRLEEEERGLVQEVHEKTARLRELQRDLSLTEERLRELTQRLQELGREEAALSVEELRPLESAPDDEEERRFHEAQQHMTRLEAELSEAKAQLQTLEERRHSLGQRWARLEGFLRIPHGGTSLEEVLVARRQELRDLEARDAALAREMAEAAADRQRIRDTVRQLEEQRGRLQQELAHGETRLRVLGQIHEEGQGLYAGVRAVLKGVEQGSIRGILGTLGSLIEVPSPLEVAIAMALGNQAQDLVAETEASARAAVGFLKRGALGRATFLPLDTVRPVQPDPRDAERLVHEAGVIGWAVELVTFPVRVRPAVQHVLGRVLIAETLDDAVRLGALHRYRYKTVTRDGQILHAGGAITGGSRVAQSGVVLNRERELAALRQRIDKGRQAVASLNRELDEVRNALSDAEGRLERLDSEKREVYHARNALRQMLEAQELQAELDDLRQEIDQVTQAIQAQHQRLEVLEREREEAGTRLSDLTARRQARQAERQAWAQAQRERSLLRQRVRDDIARVAQDGGQYRERLERLKGEMSRLDQAAGDAQERLETVRGRLREIRTRQHSARREMEAVERRISELEQRQRFLESEERKMIQKMETWRQELIALRVRYEHYRPPEGLPVLNESEEAEARHTVKRLHDALQSLDPVVPGSLALYETLTARHEFLHQERRDVVEAQRELEATLRDIDQETEARVREAKARVERHFQTAVRQLYGGGDGGFQWLAGESPGVELWVKPPGKRPSHLGLLSGGEKALGGIAWLFSLLSVRPAPFVVLDEVEASLDEASAARFAHYLKELRQGVQYVVVTHHRQTMEVADVLWGVAADGEGQSRLISVKLEAAEAIGASS